jgi:hypothetical protein
MLRFYTRAGSFTSHVCIVRYILILPLHYTLYIYMSCAHLRWTSLVVLCPGTNIAGSITYSPDRSKAGFRLALTLARSWEFAKFGAAENILPYERLIPILSATLGGPWPTRIFQMSSSSSFSRTHHCD